MDDRSELVSVMAATVHRIADVFDPLPQSSFSAEEKAAILREARKSIADGVDPHGATVGAHAPTEQKPEDPVSRWRREVDAREAEHERAREADRREQQQRQRERQQRQAGRDWESYIVRTIEAALANEREFMAEAIGEVIGELTVKIAKLESELQELRKR
jgi:hypothetical protein